MRKLNTHDLFNFTKVMKAADLKKELQPLFLKGNKIKNSIKISAVEKDINDDDDTKNDVENTKRTFGIEVILTIMEACGNSGVEDKFYKFLAGPFEIDEKEIPKLSIEALFKKIEQLAKENNLIYFFNQAANLTK